MVQACLRYIDNPCRINFPRGRAGCHKPARRHASGLSQHVVFVYKCILWLKTDQSCDGRLLVEEVPLAGLHKMNIVHTRSYRGYCCLDGGRHVCSKEMSRRTGRSTMQLYGWKDDPDAEESWIASLETLSRRNPSFGPIRLCATGANTMLLLMHEAKKETKSKLLLQTRKQERCETRTIDAGLNPIDTSENLRFTAACKVVRVETGMMLSQRRVLFYVRKHDRDKAQRNRMI